MNTNKEFNTLVIVAAGNSSRMLGMPKAILKIGGKPNLLNTIEKAYEFFDSIIIASNKTNKEIYEDIVKEQDKVQVIDIESGQGCGDAIWKILLDKRINLGRRPIICWGDTYFPDGEIFKEMLIKTDSEYSPLLIGVNYETEPYAWFDLVEGTNLIKGVNFKKRGHISNGLVPHDMSIFRIDSTDMFNYLTIMHDVLWRDDSYLNGEMIFLDSVFLLNNDEFHARIVDLKNTSYSYNTEEELNSINQKINESSSN